ncbi:MAG: helix-turn-helix domain-containing protein [Halovenus sp.]
MHNGCWDSFLPWRDTTRSSRSEEIGGLEGVPGLDESRLSNRQREAVEVALELGYYETPRTANQEDVAEAMGCATSTAAEHLQKAESKILRAVLR